MEDANVSFLSPQWCQEANRTRRRGAPLELYVRELLSIQKALVWLGVMPLIFPQIAFIPLVL